MNRSAIRKTVVGVMLASVALGASAHRAWMLPSATFVEHEEPWVTIDGAVSEAMFYLDHVPLRMDGVTVTDPDGKVAPAPTPVVSKRRTSFDLKMPKDGTYRISLVNNNVMATYKLNGEIKRYRVPEANLAKELPAGAQDVSTTTTHQRVETFVTANETSTGALKPSNSGLEMVPLTHPNDLRTGETARWRFQLDGKPLPNFPFSLVPGGVRYRGTAGEIRLVTDAKGEATVTLPAANVYWLSAAYPANLPKGPSDAPGNTRRYSYAATIEVLPE